MGRSSDYLNLAQFDLLKWVADGCADGVYEGTSYRVSARALHNRGLVRVAGQGRTWTAKPTAEGELRLKEQAQRIEAERERERREEQARVARSLKESQLRSRAADVLESVVAAGGRLDLGSSTGEQELAQIEGWLAGEGLLPTGERLAHEPTRMDPALGTTAYLEPDFAALTLARVFTVPRQLRDPHPAVVAFQDKRAYVTKSQIARASRFLQAIVTAATQIDLPPVSRTVG